jgi:hypothetical protein
MLESVRAVTAEWVYRAVTPSLPVLPNAADPPAHHVASNSVARLQAIRQRLVEA